MKKLIIILFVFFSTICYAQLPNSVKHVEIASEVCDTMVLINKVDLDVINTVFYTDRQKDSLNRINTELLDILNSEINTLKSITETQKYVIDNKEIQITKIEQSYKEVISDLEKQVKSANRKKTF